MASFFLDLILSLSFLVNWPTGFSGLLPALYSMEQPKKSKVMNPQIRELTAPALLPFHQYMRQRKSKEWSGLGHSYSRFAKIPLASMIFHL